MKMQTALFPSFVILATTAAAQAAPISWGTPFEVATPADLKVSGRKVVYAINGGDNVGNTGFVWSGTPAVQTTTPVLAAPHGPGLTIDTGAQYVNFEGVTPTYRSPTFNPSFDTFGDVTSYSTTAGSVTLATAGTRTTALPQASFDLAWSPTYAASRVYNANSGDANFDSLLASQLFIDGRNVSGASQSKLILTLNNLTIGTAYQVQVIVSADARTSATQFSSNQVALNDTAGNITPAFGVHIDTNGDGIRHVPAVIGSFTANALTQSLSVDLKFGRNTGISGLILTTAALYGDFNHDDTVNAADLARLIEGYSIGATTWEYGDLDQNGTIDLADYNAFLPLLPGGGAGNSGSGGSIPEPTSALLLTPALALLRRTRRQA